MSVTKRISTGNYTITTAEAAGNVTVNTHTLTINGNLFVEGNATYINVANISTADPTILLNSNAAVIYSGNSGIEVNRPGAATPAVYWNETVGAWQLATNIANASTYSNIGTTAESSGFVNPSTATYLTYYAATGDTVSGTGANLTWDGTDTLTVTGNVRTTGVQIADVAGIPDAVAGNITLSGDSTSGTAGGTGTYTATTTTYTGAAGQAATTSTAVSGTGPAGSTYTSYGKHGAATNGTTSAAGGAGQTTVTTPGNQTAVATHAGVVGKKTVGNTTYGGGAGAVNVQTSTGQNVTAAGGVKGSKTVNGNTTCYNTSSGGGVYNNTTGSYAAGGTNAQTSVTQGSDGRRVVNRNAQSAGAWNTRYGSGSATHTGTTTNAGSGSGSYTGSTDVNSSNYGSYSVDSTVTKGDSNMTVTNNTTSQSTTYDGSQAGSSSSRSAPPATTSSSARKAPATCTASSAARTASPRAMNSGYSSQPSYGDSTDLFGTTGLGKGSQSSTMKSSRSAPSRSAPSGRSGGGGRRR